MTTGTSAAAPVDSPAAWRRAIAALSRDDQRLLQLIALSGAQGVSRVTELTTRAGLRDPDGRLFTTRTLRPRLEALMQAQLLGESQGGVVVVPGADHVALRVAAEHGRRPLEAMALEVERHFAEVHAGRPGSSAALVRLRAGLARPDEGSPALLLAAAERFGTLTVVTEVLRPAFLLAFEEAWLRPIAAPVLGGLVEPLLRAAESSPWPLPAALRDWLRERTETWSDDLLEPLAGVAVLAGDAATLERVAGLPRSGPVVTAAGVALAITRGDRERAIALLDAPGKKPDSVDGVLGVLTAYTLICRASSASLARAAAITQRAGLRGHLFAASHAVLHAVLAATADPRRAATATLARAFHEQDALFRLLVAHYALWFPVPSPFRQQARVDLEPLTRATRAAGLGWLADQQEYTQGLLRPGGPHPHELPRAGRSAPLHALRVARPAWELALDGLEELAVRTRAAAAAAPARDERLLWRVDLQHLAVEPFVQKRSGAGWSRGRKLAVKHLTEARGAALPYPDEDRRVAEHARTEVDTHDGYPRRTHLMAPSAWGALVGHPRVHVGDDELPTEVVAGHVQVVARSVGEDLRVTVEPTDLRHPIDVRHEGSCLVVYQPTAAQSALARSVGGGFSVPPEGRQRALEVLGGATHLATVHASDRGTTRSVPADGTLRARLMPRGVGLSLTLAVRPLGDHGAYLSPGRGAAAVFGQVAGESVEATRDLAGEQRRATEVLAALGLAADDAGIDAGPWHLETLEACLEALAVLREREPEVRVEWPAGQPLRVRPRARRAALRGKVSLAQGYLVASGTLQVADDLTLDLEALVAAVAAGPGKFVKIEGGEWLELERELRELLEAMAAARTDEGKGKGKGVSLPRTALGVLGRLTAEGSAVKLDAGAARWKERLDAVAEQRFKLPRGLDAELRPYQREGFEWLCRLAELELGACLADDMGLGKTVQLIALLLHRAKLGPALVVAPTSVCDNWERELGRFAPSLGVRSYAGPGRERVLEGLGRASVVITSYTLLQQDEALQGVAWSTAILDEAQMVKNAESQRARAAATLNAAFRVVATGTPVENQLGDLYSLFRFAVPGLLGTWAGFQRRFGSAASGPAGEAARRSLKRLVQPFILRRTKGQVLTELPPITEIQHAVALSAGEARLYEAFRRAALEKLAQATEDPRTRVQVLAEITRLRRLCCHPGLVSKEADLGSSKIAAFLELVEELTAGGHRALVFSQFVDMLALVRAALDQRQVRYQYLDGGTPAKQRAAAVEAFQAGEGELFLISLRAGGFGLNLTGADYVIHLDPWWNPAVEQQASDRAHRIGQTRPVTVYRLVATGTVEERITELHQKKRELADTLLEDSDRSAKLSVDELRGLLEAGLG